MAAELIQLDALGPDGPYRAESGLVLHDVSARPVAELSVMPGLFVTWAMAALRRAGTQTAGDRAAALGRAGELFATATINGLSPARYQHLVCRVSGVPISVVRAATESIRRGCAEAYRTACRARPAAAGRDWKDPRAQRGQAIWTRRGDVLAVQAPGSHPGVHSVWIQALALGYRVAVRPSRREPFTPHRLVSALREAGFGPEQVVFLPTSRQTADYVLRAADLRMVYGGDDVIRIYSDDPFVLPMGPGHSKILLTREADPVEHLDTIVSSVAGEAGIACVNATGVFVEGDPAPVAQALAERLSAIPSLPPEDDNAMLPVRPLGEAQEIERYLSERTRGVRSWTGSAIADDLGDGSAALRPAVYQLARPDAPQTRIELGFPCVWVAPWSRDEGITLLRDSLVLTAITDDQDLVDQLAAEPTIRNIYVGDHPTWHMNPSMPHDGYLAEFLMRSKTVIGGRCQNVEDQP
jgi:acyl-CoA reductase-like NAD-dependent aldehyde dehydrogenase